MTNDTPKFNEIANQVWKLRKEIKNQGQRPIANVQDYIAVYVNPGYLYEVMEEIRGPVGATAFEMYQNGTVMGSVVYVADVMVHSNDNHAPFRVVRIK